MQENLANQEMIDATQSAVLNVAGDVANVIENTAHEIGGHGTFYEAPEFWVAVSFVLVVVLLARPLGKIIHAMLIKRGNDIAKRIDDASRLKEDAQKMLADYERKYRNAKAEAQEILSRSEREINLLKKENIAKLEKDMAIRERESKSRIETAQDEAAHEIMQLASDLAIKMAREALLNNLDDKAHDKLIDESIEVIGNLKKSAKLLDS